MLEIWGTHLETGWGMKWDKFTKFPASEIDIDDDFISGHRLHTAKLTINPNNPQELSEDIVKLAFLVSHPDVHIEKFILPYIPGARADKAPFRGARVYGRMLRNILPEAQFVVLDPHSPDAISHYTYYNSDTRIIESDKFVSKFTGKFLDYTYDAIIAPDKGAVERASKVAERLGTPCFYAEKARDPHTGKLTRYDVSGFASLLDSKGNYLVIDDICDGGGTFKMLSDAITDVVDAGTLDLFVSHGLFTGLASELPMYYDKIMTTNSVIPAQDIGQVVLNIDSAFFGEDN